MHQCSDTRDQVTILSLNSFFDPHRVVLDRFPKKIWNFYKLLKKYKEDPTENRKVYVKRRFNSLFSTKTGYGELDRRITFTKGAKAELLLVPDYPETPRYTPEQINTLQPIIT